MKARRIVALVIGCLLVLPGLGMLLGGTAVSLVYAFGRDDDGYFDATLDDFESDTAAITVGEDLVDEPGPPDWLFDLIDAEIRIRASNTDSDGEVFLGIAKESQISDYLEDVERDKIVGFDGLTPRFETLEGDAAADPPGEESFWVESAEGAGTQEIEWELRSGDWGAVLMNADGSAGISAEVDFGAKSGLLLAVAIAVFAWGWIVTAGAVLLIVYGAKGLSGPPEPASPPPDSAVAATTPSTDGSSAESPVPVTLTASLDADLSRWQWLVKWFLAIPHFIVLFFLWLAFVLLTVIAGFAILFTGRYPRGMFDFNVGVLRWTWRVSYYATAGGLGTDRYPPFTLEPTPDYPAALEVQYPEQLSRGLVLVKWWLLAIPHYLIIGILLGGSIYWAAGDDGGSWIWVAGGGGLLSVLVLIAVVALLFTGRYPRGLFDLIVGLNRWIYRVAVYAALMTDEYPPFRLDQGGDDPGSTPGEGSDLEGVTVES